MVNVLVVEDSEFMRRKIKDILSELDYSVIAEAENGQEGFDMYQELKPDLVLLDITMPIMSGRDALARILDFDEDANIIMCSTHGSNKMIRACLEEGAHGYILKPFVADQAKQSIKEVVDAVVC